MWKGILLIAMFLITTVASADIIAKTAGGDFVKTTVVVKRKDLVAEKQKLVEDKKAIKDACDAQVAAVQSGIDAVQAEIAAIDSWKDVVVDPSPYNP
jgi:hypothetical protein